MGFGYILALLALLSGVGALSAYNQWVAVQQESANSAGMTAAAFAAQHRSAVTFAEANPSFVGNINNSSLVYPGWFVQNGKWRSYVSPDRLVQTWPVTMDPMYLGVTKAAFLNDFVAIANGDAGSGIKRNSDLYTPAQGRTETDLWMAIPEEYPVHTTRLVAADPANPTIKTSESQTQSCPPGTVGSVYEIREVATTGGVPVYGPWVEVGRTCDTPVSNFEYRVEACAQSYGTLAPAHIVYRRQSVRNPDGSVSVGAWGEFFRSCPTIVSSSPIATVVVPIDTSGQNCSNAAWASSHPDICSFPTSAPCDTDPLEGVPGTPAIDIASFTICAATGACDAYDVLTPRSFTTPITSMSVAKTNDAGTSFTAQMQSNQTSLISSPDTLLRGLAAGPYAGGFPIGDRPSSSSRIIIDPTLNSMDDADFWNQLMRGSISLPIFSSGQCTVENIDQAWAATGRSETELLSHTLSILSAYRTEQPLFATENNYSVTGLFQEAGPGATFSINSLGQGFANNPQRLDAGADRSTRLVQFGGSRTPTWYIGGDPMISGIPAGIVVPPVIAAWNGIAEDVSVECADDSTLQPSVCFTDKEGRKAQPSAWPKVKYDAASRRIGWPTLKAFILGTLRYPDGRRPTEGEPGWQGLSADVGNDQTLLARYGLLGNWVPIISNWLATSARDRSLYNYPVTLANGFCYSDKKFAGRSVTSLSAAEKARLWSRVKIKKCPI